MDERLPFHDYGACPEVPLTPSVPSNSLAVVACGCFWSLDDHFMSLPGVVRTTVGYTGGSSSSPTYGDVGDHAEAIVIEFDPRVLAYRDILVSWASLHSPFFTVSATCYRSALFYLDVEQERLARKVLAALETNRGDGCKAVTAVEAAGSFFAAEEYHQKYWAKDRAKGGSGGTCSRKHTKNTS